MARGWESKAIESQQEEATRDKTTRATDTSVEERERRSRRRTLELARQRATSDLERARTEAHRAMLERTIEGIDEQLKTL